MASGAIRFCEARERPAKSSSMKVTDPNGSVLPNGAVPLIGFPGSTPTALQASESTDIARAMFEAGPGADPDAACAAVIVQTRGVVLVK